MISKGCENCIVLHISGPDKPGITSTLTGIIAEEQARLIDIGQSVLHGYLILSAIIDIPPSAHALRKILFAVSNLGLRLELGTFQAMPAEGGELGAPVSLRVTLLGNLEDGRAVAAVTEFFALHRMNIGEIKALSEGDLNGLELIVDLPRGESFSSAELQDLRGRVLNLASELDIDMAVQKDDLFRRNKRLICLDVDSTFIQMEVIDELARLSGCAERVARITERAMQGELDFKEALRERVRCLEGLQLSRARELLAQVPMTAGAEKLVSVLKSLGFKIGLVSGGFDFFVDELKQRFNLDFAFANQLEVAGDNLTGRVTGTIVDAERKAQLLVDMAQAFGCRMEQTVAVGDGANDILMLQAAGLGIAFHAKPKLQAIADLSLNRGTLDSILYLMGFDAKDLRILG
ncbi:MAG: phosphoserine phosphatase SerB [Pyrinomonadaceae bacterium]|nr:phosphoserine phosphatase SerB [Pyrinomonadaceae bacterium]